MTQTESIFLAALRKEKTTDTPIWYMRQAGRYMPEYHTVRKNFKNFLDMCKRPEVCCELALQPINAFKLDTAILFSDILTIPDAIGLGVEFIEKQGPVFRNPIKSPEQIKNLSAFNPNDLQYVYQAVKLTKSALPKNTPIIGFAGSPWTLAAYSIEGKSSKDFKYTKKFIETYPDEVSKFLNYLTNACFLYLREQVKYGADAIQIFDSWANLLPSDKYFEYSYQYVTKLTSMLKNDPATSSTPIIIFTRDPKVEINSLVYKNIDCLSLYTNSDIQQALLLKDKVAIQGNLDPKVLLEKRSIIKSEAYKLLDAFKGYPGYIFNLGHGITPDIDPSKVKYLTDIIREY